jgi:hypothetical protein
VAGRALAQHGSSIQGDDSTPRLSVLQGLHDKDRQALGHATSTLKSSWETSALLVAFIDTIKEIKCLSPNA